MRLLVHVEGQTEETFVDEIIAPHLGQFGAAVSARLLGNARQRSQRGGICAWGTAKRDIVNHLRSDAGCAATLMVDYYGLPKSGDREWPGRAAAQNLPFGQRASAVQKALLNDIEIEMGDNFDSDRFIPFVVMHEFEALLFSDCNSFAMAIGRPELAPQFQDIRDAFQSPEEINDSPITAPSKRIIGLVPGYEKPLLGVLAALDIGLDIIRAECPNFRAWLENLEALVN
jgi:uncharacterized protein DUF4276